MTSEGSHVSCWCVCNSFKKEVDSILNHNQDRLWLRHGKYSNGDDDYAHYFCYDKDHKIFSRDTLYVSKEISIKNLKFVSKLMPSLKILQLDPLNQVYLEDSDKDRDILFNVRLPDYRDKKDKAIPITKIFPQVACLILPGQTEKQNFVGDLSQVKHLTLSNGVKEESPTFPNLDSLEARQCAYYYDGYLPLSSKRFVVPCATIEWSALPKTLEIVETRLNCDEYVSIGKPHFENLKILKSVHDESLENLNNFLKDHKGSLAELSFSAFEEVANIKVLLPLLTNLQKLSVKIMTDKQAIEFKEIKALAHKLEYFELSFALQSETKKYLGLILENLPLGLDNLTIEDVASYKEIDILMEKIMEKVVNGDTKRVTIVGVEIEDEDKTNYIMDEIVKMKPELVTVKKTDIRVLENDLSGLSSRAWVDYNRIICDIVIYL